jgi:subtilisin family serine protease
MKFSTSILVATLLVTLASAVPAQTEAPARYIIKLNTGASQAVLLSLIRNFSATNKVRITYKPDFFNGFAGDFTPEFLAKVRSTYGRELQYIEKDGLVHALATANDPNPKSWGLSRIGSRTLSTTGPYTYPASAGKGINVYVVDTGVQFNHTDFEKRAELVKAIVSEANPDENGHGTHCSGTIASKTYGVAKAANIKGVKVLNSAGSGTYADVVLGIQFVAEEAKKNKSGRLNTVMSMSLGGPTSQAVNDAANAAVDAGVVAIVAAGNNAGDACSLSPAGASKVFAIGATDKTDTRASYSNFGKCVKVFAPGSDITSLWKGANGATNTISGTSMAAPHVAGVAALYMADKVYTKVADVYADIQKAASKKVVKNQGAGSPNNDLVYAQNIAN